MPNPSPDAVWPKEKQIDRPSPRRPKKLKKSRPDHKFAEQLRQAGFERIIGIDEVGRGALAGPIIVAAVELHQPIDGINDSKLISAINRRRLAESIYRYCDQIAFGWCSNQEIDQLGLVEAQDLAYRRCLDQLEFSLVLTDNYRLNHPHIKIVKGDQLFYPVAAASIVAKVYRDQLMRVYHQFFPTYGWADNVGYGTPHHLDTITRQGSTSLHRQSFSAKRTR